jgi:hypothetical protein
MFTNVFSAAWFPQFRFSTAAFFRGRSDPLCADATDALDTQTSKAPPVFARYWPVPREKAEMHAAKNESAVGGLLGLQPTNFFRPLS